MKYYLSSYQIGNETQKLKSLIPKANKTPFKTLSDGQVIVIDNKL